MNNFPILLRRGVFFILAPLLFIATLTLNGQGTNYTYFYRVYFKDKGSNNISGFTPSDLLSSRAIARRQKSGVIVPDFRDLPVWKGYIQQISAAGFKLHCTSKWLNTALFKTQTRADVNILLGFPFVSSVKIVKTPGTKSNFNDKLRFQTEQSEASLFDRPLTMVNGLVLQNSGYTGNNILIAILDGGFMNADQISSLDQLRRRNGIKATYDFVNNVKPVYNTHTHGTDVLSILAGKIPDIIAGSAPGADFLLLKTEDVNSEFPCEEDFWAAGAEYADSTGADIISSSLGYFNFDDPSLNYKLSDLDGNTAFVTRAADVAASKGILVVNSAGNERTGTWKKIIFPADGDSVLAAGAVDANTNIADFSSAGPSADRRIKPDNAAMGVNVPLQPASGPVVAGSGTSFSCPVLSGMAACLMQAVPLASNNDIIKVFHSSANRFLTPDSLYGYGIPDMLKALNQLQDIYLRLPDEEAIAYPNPTTGTFEIIFRHPPAQIIVEIVSISGKLIYRKDFSEYAGRSILIDGIQNREQGIYLIRLITGNTTIVRKIIKLKN